MLEVTSWGQLNGTHSKTMIINKQGLSNGEKVLLRMVREGPEEKVTFKQGTEREIQVKACSCLGHEHSRKGPAGAQL